LSFFLVCFILSALGVFGHGCQDCAAGNLRRAKNIIMEPAPVPPKPAVKPTVTIGEPTIQ
jgi:hypothetical protein